MIILPFLTLAALLAQAAPPSPDFGFFRDRVQPIFLKKRLGHARCITCHDHGSPALVPLAPGATWNEEQSRKNFDMWKAFVKPGEPLKSPLLLHPLAESAGGDRFHAGGRHWQSQSDPEWQTLAAWVKGEKELPALGTVARVLQTNAAGDNIHIIDPATNRIVGTIGDIEVPHGVALSPDGTRVYISDESLSALDVVDAATLKVTKRIPLSGRPNNLDVTSNGRKVYIAIRESPGAVDVVDTVSMTKVKSVAVKGAIHNVYVTADGKYAVAGSIDASTISVIDTTTDNVAWALTLDAGIRPMAFTRNADGSTKEIIVQLSNFHGFAVVDFATRKEVRRITMPDPKGQERETQGLQGSPSHGLAITPDGKMLWSTSKYYDYVAAYSLPDFKLLKVVHVGLHPEWLTIPPDGKSLYIAVAGTDSTVVVDNKTMKVVATIPVGSVPKRNTSGLLINAR